MAVIQSKSLAEVVGGTAFIVLTDMTILIIRVSEEGGWQTLRGKQQQQQQQHSSDDENDKSNYIGFPLHQHGDVITIDPESATTPVNTNVPHVGAS